MEPTDQNENITEFDEKAMLAQRVVRSTDPDTYSDPESARVRARQLGCIGIRRYMNRDGSQSWMPCTNESDYRKYSGQGFSGRKFRRQQIQNEVRNVIGRNFGRSFREKSANYTKPELRERLKQRILSGSKGGRPGQWSARKAQLLAIAYKKAGGGYKGGKSQKQRSLVRWGKEKWRTSDGKPAIRGRVTRRYLPAKAWEKLTPEQRAATNRKKITGSKRGRQFVPNTETAASVRKRVSRGVKNIEFYEELDIKAIGQRVGGRIGRAIAPGDGGGPRRGRASRLSRAVGRLDNVAFDPNPIDADADLQVQEGTRWERTITPQASLASRLGRGAVATPRRQAPAGRTQREVVRGAKKPQAPIRRVQKPREEVGTAIRAIPEVRKPEPVRTPAKRTRKPIAAVAEPSVLPSAERQQEVRRSFEDLSAILDRTEKARIYKAWNEGRYSASELADQFDVVRDEINSVIKDHTKYRESSYRAFRKSNPKLARAIDSKFDNTKANIEDAIRDGIIRNWDGLLNYALRSPGDRATKERITRELFNASTNGADPDGKGNMVLGYRRSKRNGVDKVVRDIADRNAMPSDFTTLYQYRQVAPTIDSRAASSRDMNERASRAREFRKYQRTVDASNMWDTSISGRMSAGPSMTPAEENQWRMQEWKRQQLKKLALNPEVGNGNLPTLAGILGNGDLAQAINAIDDIPDDSLNSVWDGTVQELMQSGARIPAYRAKSAPLTPRELAIAANAKRPLVAAFLDEAKKLNPSGNFARINIDSLADKDVEDLFNTFILPELTNPDAPSIQDVQIAAGLPQSREMVSLADSVAWLIPDEFKDLEVRTLIAKQQLKDIGMNEDDPAFDSALQQLIDEEYNKEMGDIEKWLENGAPPLDRGQGGGGKTPPPINPSTGQPFGEDDWRETINELINRYETESNNARQALEEVLGELYEIGRAQGWIDDANEPGGQGDDDDSFNTFDEDVERNLPPLEDEFGFPDTDEAWDAPYVDENGNEIPYDGSDTHPLNVNPETNQPYNVEENNQMDEDLYRFFLDPNNMHVREWMDLDNTHTVARYAKPPAELASRFYQGDIDDPNPEKIDQRIDWNRLVNYIQKVAPHFFSRDKQGELVANLAEITRSGDYDGASFNATPDPDADPSGYQFREQIREFIDAKRKEEAQLVASTDQAGKARRAALWKLLETDTLTPDEIAFDEQMFDVANVNAALSLYALENKVSNNKLSSLLKVAKQAQPSRADDYAKRRVERIAQQFRDQGKSSRQALAEIDRAIEHQIELRTKVGIEYDNMRREHMALRNMVTSLLMMRPKNRKQTYNADGSVRRRGWDPKKESSSRYLNRIARWDREFIGHIDANGKWRPGVVSQLVSRLRQLEITTGAVAGGGATSDIFQTADQNISRLRDMREQIEEARGEAKRFGISGFMKSGGADSRLLGRAEESARASARRAASGHSIFASPRNLKRYDDFGLPISRQTRISASGFNKRLRPLTQEATRSNSFKWSESKYFSRLPDRLKDIVRGLDETPQNFSSRGFRAMFPARTARRGQAVGNNIARDSDYEAFELLPANPLFGGNNKKAKRTSITGAMRLYTDEIGDNWFVTDRNGDIVVSTPFDSHEDALFYVRQNQQGFEDKPEFQFNDMVRFNAYKKRIDTYPYHGEARIREIASQMNTVWVENQAKGPKKTAADSIIMRMNPETGEKEVAMIRRGFPPFSGDRDVTLPGGFVDPTDLPDGKTQIDDDVFVTTALREQLEEVGIKESDILASEFIGEFDEPDWDPRFPNGMRVGGVYFEVKPDTQLVAADDAKEAFWVPIEKLARGDQAVGFGHAGFISAMLWNDDDADLADRMAIVSQLARRRNQRIIREVNRQRALRNAGRPKDEQVPLFPRDLPNPDVGYIPGGKAAEDRARATYRRLTGRMSGSPVNNTELNDRVRYALVNYSGDGFGLLNQILRETDGLVLDRNLIKNREALRNSIDSTDPSSLATRIAMGTDESYSKLMKELEIYRDMNDWLSSGSVPENTILYRTLGTWKGIDDLEVGDEFFDAAFQSTTSNEEQEFLYGPRNLRIFVGSGISGRSLRDGIDVPRHSEDEVILPAGVRYKILRAPDRKSRSERGIGSSFWDVEIVGQGITGAMGAKSRFPWNVDGRDARAKDKLPNNDNSLNLAIKRSVSGKMALPRKQFVGRDFYGELDVKPTATYKELKKAYREIAKIFHPDKNPGDKVAADKFRRATEAYEVLSDARERDYYDSTILPNVSRDAAKASEPQSRPAEPPRRPSWMPEPPKQERPLPKLKNVLGNRLGLKIPVLDNIIPGQSSLTRYQRGVNEPGIDVQSSGYGKIRIDEDRFWDVHYAIAKAINDAVTKKRQNGKPKRYIVIGGPPASGKSSLRLDKSLEIPSFNEAIHVDADEIKEMIPEAKKAHALNNPQWASVVHDESRMIVNTSLRMGIERNNDIVHDSLGQFVEGLGALKAARASGYDVVAHYVVASPEVIKARLNEREKTDPRIIPRHIVDATISNNKFAMIDVADFADEFYLYDGSSDSRKLIARKAKGGKLEVLDPVAYKYGEFERIQDQDDDSFGFFERPDTGGRTSSVAKNNNLADVIRDFDNGSKVSDLAKKYKMTNRKVWDTVTKYSVDESRTEAPPPPQRKPRFDFGGQGRFDFGDAYSDRWDYGTDGLISSEDLDKIPPMYVGTYEQEIWDRVAETVDAGLETDLLDYIHASMYRSDMIEEMSKSLKDMGWTDAELAILGSFRYGIQAVLEPRPKGNGEQIAKQIEVWLDTLFDDDRKELLQLVGSLADDAKNGVFAPMSEFVGLSDEFGIPLWAIDELYERAFSGRGGVSGNMSGNNKKKLIKTTPFVEPRPNIPKKELTADDVKVIKYPDSDVPALKLPVLDEVVSIIHPDNPNKSKNPDLQNDDYSFVDYLKGVQYPTEPQIEEINKFIAEQKKQLKRLTTNWKFTASNGSELKYGQKLPDDIDSFDVKTSDGVFLFRVKKLKNLDSFNERHVVMDTEFAQQVTPESLFQEVFKQITNDFRGDEDIDMLDNSMSLDLNPYKFDPPFSYQNQAKLIALRAGYDPKNKFERDNFSGVELEFGSTEEADFVKSNIQRYQQVVKLNSDFTFEFYEHLSDLREKMGLSREDLQVSNNVLNSKNDSIISTRNKLHGPNTKSPYSIDAYSFNYTGHESFLTSHEMFHIAGGQGFDRHGDHTANRMYKFVFPNHWNIPFNYVTSRQNFSNTLDRIPLWAIIPESMMNQPGE